MIRIFFMRDGSMYECEDDEWFKKKLKERGIKLKIRKVIKGKKHKIDEALVFLTITGVVWYCIGKVIDRLIKEFPNSFKKRI